MDISRYFSLNQNGLTNSQTNRTTLISLVKIFILVDGSPLIQKTCVAVRLG